MPMRFKCCHSLLFCNCNMSLPQLLKSRRFWIRTTIVCLYILTITVILPILVIKAIKDSFKRRFYMIPIIGGVFVIMTLPIAFWLITQHMLYYSKPKLQKHIIRVLWMVPIYSLNAFFSLLYPNNTLLLDSFRECYEAYVIYSFMMFLSNYLRENYDDIEDKIKNKPQIRHFFPFCKLEEWRMGKELIHNCKHGILQYTVTRPLMTVFILLGHYNGNRTKELVVFALTMIVNNLSQFIAMYCLVLFYLATKEELAPMKPIGKFLCIKMVIFFSFFQSVIINVLVYTGVLQPFLRISDIISEENGDLAAFIQNFLLCIEMFLAAIGHHLSYSIEPYLDPSCARKTWKEAFLALWDFSDVGADIKEHLGVVGTSISRHIKNRNNLAVISSTNVNRNESSPLLIDGVKKDEDLAVTVGHRASTSSNIC